MIQTDFLVIGSGIAGLTYAIRTAEAFPDKIITIITKGDSEESNTKYAQGGVAAVWDNNIDSFNQHIQDTLIAGDGLCDEKTVKIVITEGPQRLKELMQWGAHFDLNNSGTFSLGKEGGHSQNRILHHKDITGYEIERALLERVQHLSNIQLKTQHFAIDLITEHQTNKALNLEEIKCYGAYVLNEKNNKVITISSKITLLATGGIGHVYLNTTNPAIATGDGIAIAYRAKAKIKEMEFIQFHPTALYNPGNEQTFLISEAVRGFGAVLRDKKGVAFMDAYDNRKDLAPRDIVARAIDSELKKTANTHVYLDCTHLDQNEFFNHFPNIYEKCKSIGIDLFTDFIPVVPAAHYLCGGVTVNENGQTSISNLYACGECSRTGLHGANRLASNSLLEALVYSYRCFKSANTLIENIAYNTAIPQWKKDNTKKYNEKILITHNQEEVRKLMNDYVGIVRTNERLSRAQNRLKILYAENKKLYDSSFLTAELCELRNMITTSYLITKFSIAQTKNCGGYYNLDLTTKF